MDEDESRVPEAKDVDREGDEKERENKIQMFQNVCHCENSDIAIQLLEITSWKVKDAIELYLLIKKSSVANPPPKDLNASLPDSSTGQKSVRMNLLCIASVAIVGAVLTVYASQDIKPVLEIVKKYSEDIEEMKKQLLFYFASKYCFSGWSWCCTSQSGWNSVSTNLLLIASVAVVGVVLTLFASEHINPVLEIVKKYSRDTEELKKQLLYYFVSKYCSYALRFLRRRSRSPP